MIWAVVSKSEMEGYDIPPVFQYYREVVGKENIRLAVVSEDDPLCFIQEDDVVLLRTASNPLIKTILDKKVKTTAEKHEIYNLANDKFQLSKFLTKNGVLVPKQYDHEPRNYDNAFFVKPRFGSESFGISSHNICATWRYVERVSKSITDQCGQPVVIEDFIDGVDCTVACYATPSGIKTHAIIVECEETGGIQTHTGKFAYNEYCHAITGNDNDRICDISRNIFKILGIKHHARIDFRKGLDGKFYLIDVNLIPGLGPSAHFSKCLLLTENISYSDAINAVLQSAS